MQTLIRPSMLLVLLATAVLNADDKVFSGPQVGELLPPLKVNLAYGPNKGNEIDLIREANGRPTLLVIVNGANRPAARLTRALLNYAEMRDGLYAALVWIDADQSGAQQYLRRAISWWGVGVPVGVSVDGGEGPGSYGLNRKVNVTVLVADKNRVTANFALVQPSEMDAPRILTRVVRLVGGQVPTQAESIFLSVPTRKPENAKWHVAPRDIQFRRLICELLAAQDQMDAKEKADAIDQFVGADFQRQRTRSRVATVLSQGRTKLTPSPASQFIQRWIRQTEAQ